MRARRSRSGRSPRTPRHCRPPRRPVDAGCPVWTVPRRPERRRGRCDRRTSRRRLAARGLGSQIRPRRIGDLRARGRPRSKSAPRRRGRCVAAGCSPRRWRVAAALVKPAGAAAASSRSGAGWSSSTAREECVSSCSTRSTARVGSPGCQRVVDRLVEVPVFGEPRRRGAVEPFDAVGIVTLEAAAEKVGEHLVVAEPVRFVVDALKEQPAVLDVVEHRLAARHPRQRGCQPAAGSLGDRGHQHELGDLRFQGVQNVLDRNSPITSLAPLKPGRQAGGVPAATQGKCASCRPAAHPSVDAVNASMSLPTAAGHPHR